MHQRTQATLNELENAHWFSNVGQPVEGPFVQVTSWAEAIASCGSTEWQELLLEASNRYCEAIAKRSPVRWARWNSVVGEIKPLVLPIVDRKVRGVIDQFDLPKIFVDTVEWDILHVCMEAEYADVYPPGFFASQAFWYVRGHYPCGWQASFPDGKLILY